MTADAPPLTPADFRVEQSNAGSVAIVCPACGYPSAWAASAGPVWIGWLVSVAERHIASHHASGAEA